MPKIYEELNSRIGAMSRCSKEWKEKHQKVVDKLMEKFPSGSGFDSGTELHVRDCQYDKKLVFFTAFHHMDSNGFYTRWTQHYVIVTPVLSGINIRVTGVNHNAIKDYIAEVFSNVLNEEVPL